MSSANSIPARGTLACIAILLLCGCGEAPVVHGPYRATRLNEGQPIITRAHFEQTGAPSHEGEYINGPHVIAVPVWLKESGRVAHPDANYYMYFAHHRGLYIRLAWATELTGPWRLHGTGADVPVGSRGVLDMGADQHLAIGNALVLTNHVASPEVWVDHEQQRLVMYFHAPTVYRGKRLRSQYTAVATSADGLNFNLPAQGGQPGHGIRPVILGRSYMRLFHHRGQAYAVANGASPFRAPAGANATSDGAWMPPPEFVFRRTLWDKRETEIIEIPAASGKRHPVRVRHVALHLRGDTLDIFFSRRGDAPERILHTTVDLSSGDWTAWEAAHPAAEVLTPQLPWEGGTLKAKSSRRGRAVGVRQLRDPYVFEEDGRLYLFYSGRGEDAIGMALLERLESE